MKEIQDFLIHIGANSKDFETGMIAGAIIVMIALFVVLIFSALAKKAKKSVGKTNSQFSAEKEEIKELKAELERVSGELAAKEEKKFTEGALYTLVLLQREGRFVDFIKENIEAFEDSQIGAAVRQIHAGCRKVIDDNFNVKALFDKPEGEKVSLGDDFDPGEVKMSGNVPEKAPYNGELKHKGWKSDKVKLPKRTDKVNVKVVCPAEIEF